MVFDDLEALGDLRVDILLRVEHNEALHPDNDEYFFKDEVGGLDIWYGFALLYDDMWAQTVDLVDEGGVVDYLLD